MWSRPLFIVWLLALTILATQSHDIRKRGLISKLFGGSSKSDRNFEGNLPPKERSRFRELLKNPLVIAMLGAAVGMIVQKAIAAKNMNDVCENQYVKMALTAGNLSPEIRQVVNLLGCNAANRHYGSQSTTVSPYGIKSNTTAQYGLSSTTPFGWDNDNDEGTDKNQDETLENSLPPEHESKIKQLLAVFKGEKGAKRNFVRGLFGMKKKDYSFKKGQKLPSSNYKLDKDDANALKDLEKELEIFNKDIH